MQNFSDPAESNKKAIGQKNQEFVWFGGFCSFVFN